MRGIFFLLSLLVFSQSWANNTTLDSLLKPAQPAFLPVEQAFKLDFDQQGSRLFVGWDIEAGYYLYKHKLEFVGKGVTVHVPELAQGKTIEDEFFGKTEVYFNHASVVLKLSNVSADSIVKVRYQGCAEAGLCYPPEVFTIELTPLANSANTSKVNAATPQTQSNNTTNNTNKNQTEPQTTKAPSTTASDDSLTDKLAKQGLLTNLAIFFMVGVGLAFTPCVFPMFPILSSLIAGQQQLSTKKAFSLSFVYVQGMAVTYAALGLVVASLGGQVQGYLQHPYVLIAFSLLFVLLAMAMFGWYEIRLPQGMMNRLSAASNKQQGGSYLGVFVMGVLSGLIASPCTTAPLSAALLYVAQSGDYLVGGLTLYVLSLGMGIPLLLLGTSGGKLLPKAGGWMEQVKVLFGFIMLVVPLILLERIVSFNTILLLGGILAIATAAYLHFWQSHTAQGKLKTVLWLVATLFVTSGILLIKQVMLPTNTAVSTSQASHKPFVKITNLAELNALLANTQGLVMVDLYADWCVACKEFEHYTFSDPQVQQLFNNFTLVQIDLTQSNDTTMEFMDAFNVFGLPSILFFDKQNKELSDLRVTGFLNAKQFAEHLRQVELTQTQQK